MLRQHVMKCRAVFAAVATAFLLAIGLPAAQAQNATPAAYQNPFNLEVLYSFSNLAYGASPMDVKVVFDSAGDAYGTTSTGGLYNYGTIWELTATGLYKDLHDFSALDFNTNTLPGFQTYGVTLDSAGNLFGTTRESVWELTNTGVYKTLHEFGASDVTNSQGKTGPDGCDASSAVTIDQLGNLYGTAMHCNVYTTIPPGYGMVWEITADGVYKDLHDFGQMMVYPGGTQGLDGAQPTHGVTIDSQGNLYGATLSSGLTSSGNAAFGVLWEITNSGTYKVLHGFGGQSATRVNGTSGPDGSDPENGVTIDSSGNLFGTAFGGEEGRGVIWEYSASGTYQILHDFLGVYGTIVNANGTTGHDGDLGDIIGYKLNGGAIAFDASGNMYGSTVTGGALGAGMIWEIPSGGVYKDIYDFLSCGDDPCDLDGDVSFGNDGNMYGTFYTGQSGLGSVWKLLLPPAAPTDLTGSAGVQMVSFCWNPVPNATSYNYYRSNTSGTETLTYTGITQTCWRNLSRTPGETLYYQVTAVNAYGESPRSNEIILTPLPLPAPTAAAAAGNGTITLSWAPVSATGELVTYSIFRGTSSSGESLTPIATGLTGLYYTDANVTNGTAYYYTVQAVDPVSSSAQSEQISATPSSGIPLAPTNLTGSAGVQAAFFSWTASAGATSYNYYKSWAPGDETLDYTGITQTGWRNITQKPGTTIYYQVTAVNASGESARSNEIAVTPLPLPAPSPVTATGGTGQVTLSWGAVTSLGVTTTYSLFRGTASGGESATPIASGLSTTSYTDASVTSGTTYYYTVQAVNLVSSSVQSSEVSAVPQ